MERTIPWILLAVAGGGYFLSAERPNDLVISLTLRLVILFAAFWLVFAALIWLRELRRRP